MRESGLLRGKSNRPVTKPQSLFVRSRRLAWVGRPLDTCAQTVNSDRLRRDRHRVVAVVHLPEVLQTLQPPMTPTRRLHNLLRQRLLKPPPDVERRLISPLSRIAFGFLHTF